MKRLILAVTALLCLLMPVASASAAFDPLGNACGAGGAGNSSACSTNGKDPVSGSGGILMKASLVLATIGGVAAVIIIIVAGLSFITANGDPSKISNARNAIVGSIIGLVIIAVAEGLVIFVVNKL